MGELSVSREIDVLRMIVISMQRDSHPVSPASKKADCKDVD